MDGRRLIGEGFSLFPGILVFSEFWVKRDFGVVARVRDLFCFVFQCWAFRFNCVTDVAAVASRWLPPLLRVCCRRRFAFVAAVASRLLPPRFTASCHLEVENWPYIYIYSFFPSLLNAGRENSDRHYMRVYRRIHIHIFTIGPY